MSRRLDEDHEAGYVSVTHAQMKDIFDEHARTRHAQGRYWDDEKSAMLTHGTAEQLRAYADRDRSKNSDATKPVESRQRPGDLAGFLVGGSHYIGTTESARVKEELSRLKTLVRSSDTAGPQRATIPMSDGSGFLHVTVMRSSSDIGVSASVVLSSSMESITDAHYASPLFKGTRFCFPKAF
jgi:hypothetical protein